MKKLMLALAACAVVGSAMAEGASYDFTPVTTEVTSMATAIKSWITAALPVVLGIAGGFLVFWLARIAIRILKSLGRAGG